MRSDNWHLWVLNVSALVSKVVYLKIIFNGYWNCRIWNGVNLEDIIFSIQEYFKWSKRCRRIKRLNNNCRKYKRSLLGWFWSSWRHKYYHKNQNKYLVPLYEGKRSICNDYDVNCCLFRLCLHSFQYEWIRDTYLF